jgi:hypothetical protein
MAPWSVTYTINGTNPATLNNIIDNPYLLPVSSAGSYKVVQVQDAFCVDTVSTGSTEITVKALPAANLSSANAAICPGSSANIVVDLMGTAPWAFTYTINGLNHSTVAGVTSSPYVLPVSQAGLYQLTGVSDEGCIGSDVTGAAMISENPLPAVNLGNDVIIVAGERCTLDAGASFAWYLWSDGSNGQTLQVSTSGDYEVTVTDHLGCSNSDIVRVTVTDIPVNRDLEFLNITGTECFSATQTITVAGSRSTFIVQDGGQATLIAGQNIICLPGTMVESGGYLHGYITPDSTYCGGTTMPVAPFASNNTPVAAFSGNLNLENILKIYPNPSTGIITMAIKNPGKLDLQIEIMDMAGRHVYSKAIGKVNLTEQVDLGLFRSGFYLVKLTSGNITKITKLVLID